MARRIVRTDDPLGTRSNAAQSASESAALATMAGGMMLGAMWPREAEAENALSRTNLPDNDIRPDDQSSYILPEDQPAATGIPDHAGIRAAADPDADLNVHAPAAGAATALPDVTLTAAPSVDVTGNAGTGAAPDRDSATPSTDAEVAIESPVAEQASFASTPTLLPSLFDSVAHVTDNVTDALTGSVGATLAATAAQLDALLGANGLIGDVTATLGDTFAATQNVTQDLLYEVAGIAAPPFEPLTDILGAPSNADTSPIPAVASLAPDMLDNSPMIDTSFDMASLMPTEVTGLTLGFLGTSYADAVDPHDLSFSPLGGGLHGLV